MMRAENLCGTAMNYQEGLPASGAVLALPIADITSGHFAKFGQTESAQSALNQSQPNQCRQLIHWLIIASASSVYHPGQQALRPSRQCFWD